MVTDELTGYEPPKMPFPEVRRGDEFAVDTERFFGRLINIRGRLRAEDCEASYPHYGLITSMLGDTFESRRRIDEYNLDDYAGKRIIIMRPTAPCQRKKDAIKELIGRLKGRRYPWWRILWHLLTPALARRLSWSGIPVCSELGAWYRHLIGIRHEYYMGTTPDVLVDEARIHRDYEIIFEGRLPEREQ